MDLAITMASKSIGQTGINPVVGCVIVKEGRIVGLGAHLRRGEGHAEVNAMAMAQGQAEGSTVYVTLEPCSHYGITPPCAQLLIRNKVARVVVATVDPNPLVAGEGIKLLREAQIEVTVGVLNERATKMNEVFNKYVLTKRPFVTLKSASTLDGKLSTYTGHSRWISGEQARAEVHTLRHQHQAIMVGIETVIADDPSLTTRLAVSALQPVPIVIDSQLRIPLSSKLVAERGDSLIVFTTESSDPAKWKALEEQGVTIVACGQGRLVDLDMATSWLGSHHIASVLLEGGGKLNGAMLQLRLVDKMVLYYGTKIVGGSTAPSLFQMDGVAYMNHAIQLVDTEVAMVGKDIRLVGYPMYENHGASQGE